MDNACGVTKKNLSDDVRLEDGAGELEENGFVWIRSVLSHKMCNAFIDAYDTGSYRKTVVMERHRYGLGEYKYFDYPLPEFVERTRKSAYSQLAPLANEWAKKLKLDIRFPADFYAFRQLCHDGGQMKPTPLILKYGKGGFNTLHQDIYGDIYFPFQIAVFLSEPNIDYSGGEFVLTRQLPRAQSKAIVLQPRKGDAIVFATRFHPVKGTRGHYRSVIKHGVSEIRCGARFTLGIIFHDADS